MILQAAGHHEGICIFQIDWPSRIESGCGSVNRIIFVVQMDESRLANHPTLRMNQTLKQHLDPTCVLDMDDKNRESLPPK